MKKMKKALSLFLALVMVLGMVNLSVFAQETSGKIVSQKEEWTMTDDGSVGHKKTIKKTGENTFEITLSVKTKEEITQQVSSPDAAVVVVMDVSNSMAWTVDGKEAKDEAQQRITKAKAAAEKFIEDFASDAGNAQRKVALVEFGSNAMTVQGWTDATTAKDAVSRIDINFGTPACTIQGTHTHNESTIEWGGLFHNRWRCTEETCEYYQKDPGFLWTNWYSAWKNGNYEGHTHEKTYNGSHGKTTNDGGGTNIEGGLQLADNLLSNCSIPNAKKYVVLITDGVPTYHVYQDHYTQGDTSFIEGQKGGGNYAAQSDYKNVPNVANNIKAKGTLYTVSYASSIVEETVGGKSIDAWLASFATKNVPAEDKIDWGLGQISETIKNQAQAWILTDPIPAPYIVYKSEDNVMIPDADVNPNSVLNYKTTDQGTTLTWNLKDDTAKTQVEGGVKWYYYETSYVVHLDTTAEGFEEDKPYATNDTTTLTYMLTKDGVLQSDLMNTNLVVPEVSGKLPTVGWTIEYYKETDDGSVEYNNKKYTQDTNATETGTDKFGTKVVLSDEDANYADKYDNYTCVSANETITLGLDPNENVIKVYYDRKTTSAVVNYHYELTTINEDGETTTTNDVNGTPVTGLFVGDEYSANAPETNQYGGYTYSFDHADPSTTIKALDKDGSKNVIDLYYKATIDERADASVVVDHVYTLHTYELENGKYVEKDVVTNVDKVEEETGLKAGETYTANTTPRVGFNGYQYEGVSGWDNVKTLSDGENVITLYFENWEDLRGPELSLTVKHHYTKSVTEIVDGNVVTTVDPDNVVGHTDTIKFYAGETVTVDKQRVYNGDTYEIAGTSDTVTLPNPVDGAEYSLFYTLTEVVPEKTTVTVTHIYQTVTYETVTTYEEVEKEVQKVDENGEPVFEQKVDENGKPVFETVSEPVLDENGEPTVNENGEPIMQDVEKPVMVPVMETVTEKVETGKEVVAKAPVTDDTVTVTDNTVYVGQSYTAPVVGRDRYVCQTDENGRTAIVEANGATAINVYYLKDEKDNIDDKRDEAIIDVQHVYTTHVTAIVGGEVKEFDTFFTVPGETYTGKAGDTYKAKPERSYGGIEYTLVGEEPAEKVLHAGTNSTIVINYERADNQLGEQVDYTVNYEYYTRTMTVENGVAVWGKPVKESETPASSAKGHVGQKVELDTGAKDGYTAYGNNPSATQFLAESGNEWTFKYVKDVELERVPVTVNHHVTTKTLTIDGESSFTQDLMGRPEYKYVGESYETEALELGENATLTLVNVNGNDVETKDIVTFDELTGTTVVDFYYEIVIDYRHPVNYSIQYYYYDVDYDGKETLTGEPQATTGSSFVGKTLDTTPEKEDIKGYKLTEATFNGVDILDQQSVTLVEGKNEVVYIYKRTVDTRPETSVKVIHEYYASASAETPAFTDEEITNNLRAPSEFTATAKPTKNDVTYTQTTENSALTITLGVNAEDNVIVIKYVRANTSYQVVHEYYTDNVLSGSTSSVVAGEAGATITADSISKVLSYGGNSYSYTSASGAPLTLVQGENGTITLRYDRTTSTWTPDPDPVYYKLTINYVDEDGNVVAAQYVSGRHTSGWKYDIASPEVEGYTPNKAAVTGTLTRNTTLEVVYTKDVEIEDDNPPLAEPDTFKLTVHYVYADGSMAAEDSVKDGLLAGDSYSVTSPVLEGYTVDYELVAGTMPGEDLEFTVVYTPVETEVPEEQPPLVDVPDEQPPLVDVPDVQPPLVDVPDEQPPLVDVPDVQPPLVEWPDTVPVVNVPDEQPPLVEVPDEDVPMAGVPQTGDYSTVWYVAAVLSALGLAVLTLKKREDEEG